MLVHRWQPVSWFSEPGGPALVGRNYNGHMLVRRSRPRDFHQIAEILESMGHDGEAWDYREAADDGLQLPFPSWVSVDGAQVVGMLEGRFNSEYDDRFQQSNFPPPQAWVYLIGVSHDFRRRGIGRALLRQFSQEAVVAGCGFVALMPDNGDDHLEERIRFFRACGLEPLNTDDASDVHGAPLAQVIDNRASGASESPA